MSTSEDFRYASAPERREQLLRVVEEQGYSAISELSDMFHVSEMTIRRDVAKLVASGKLRSFHGGVSALTPQDLEGSSYTNRLIAHGDVKWRITERALQLVSPGSVIAIDAGTTGAALAAQVPRDAGIRVVTASLPVINELAGVPEVDVTSLGGVLHHESLSFAGPSTLAAIANLNVGIYFLAASGLSARGAFCATDFDAVTKRALIDAAEQVVLISDSSKFSIGAMVKVCGWDAISTIVVDDDLDDDTEVLLQNTGVTIVRVPAHTDTD